MSIRTEKKTATCIKIVINFAPRIVNENLVFKIL
jgi:hypothetical protein